jgi:HPt (histidine-containing phosphotransfer) domain-containing protein
VSAAGEFSLPCVEGLDTADGLSRVAGNRKLYLKLLRQFVEQQGPAGGQICEALVTGEAKVAERLAHTVKGVAGSLGARGVQVVAAKLEKAVAGSASEAELTPLLAEFRTVLDDFTARLQATLPGAAPTAAMGAPTAAPTATPAIPSSAWRSAPIGLPWTARKPPS